MSLSVILIVLATYYITYVVTASEFPPILYVRDRVVGRWGLVNWRGYLATCGWCASIYVGAVVTGITAQVTNVPLPVLVCLSSAGVTGTLLELINGK